VTSLIRTWLDKNIRSLVIALMMAMVFLYFIYMTVQGDRGILSMLRLQRDLRTAESALAETRGERQVLEARVKHMRPNSIDPDLLDEQSRQQLNLAKPNEVVILTAPQQGGAKKDQMLQRSKN
jgi:cell division protein FtsB